MTVSLTRAAGARTAERRKRTPVHPAQRKPHVRYNGMFARSEIVPKAK